MDVYALGATSPKIDAAFAPRPGENYAITVTRNAAGDAASPSQSGLLLMYSDGKTRAEASAITVTP